MRFAERVNETMAELCGGCAGGIGTISASSAIQKCRQLGGFSLDFDYSGSNDGFVNSQNY